MEIYKGVIVSCVSVKLKLLKHGEGLGLPSYATCGSAGADLKAANLDPVEILPGTVELIPCGFNIAIPDGYEGQVRSRSGLSLKNSLIVLNSPGTIDSDYRGEVKLIMMNLSNKPFVIERGMRLAQLVICPVIQADFEIVDELPATCRKDSGFGSTGIM